MKIMASDIREHLEFNQNGIISVIHKCQTNEAMKLCIPDLYYKLKHANLYDIGGTYSNTVSDLWFYMTTAQFSDMDFLVNIFVMHRKEDCVSITINYNGVISTETLKSCRPNQNYHIRTFWFSEESIRQTGDATLFIPITINTDPNLINQDVIRKMKLKHNLSEQISLNEKTDFILQSASAKEYHVHKIIVAAHSPVLRDILKDPSRSSIFIDVTDEDMEMLIQFLYTGSIEDIQNKDCIKLQELAIKFELSNLFLLAQYAISGQINIDNAVNIALIAKKHNLQKLWHKTCNFIRKHPKVMETESWKTLQDVELTKELCMFFVK